MQTIKIIKQQYRQHGPGRQNRPEKWMAHLALKWLTLTAAVLVAAYVMDGIAVKGMEPAQANGRFCCVHERCKRRPSKCTSAAGDVCR